MTMKKKDICLRVTHWVILLIEEFQYTIEHRFGSMRHVNALSSNPVNVLFTSGGQEDLAEKNLFDSTRRN